MSKIFRVTLIDRDPDGRHIEKTYRGDHLIATIGKENGSLFIGRRRDPRDKDQVDMLTTIHKDSWIMVEELNNIEGQS
jgi:hypothetical protein